MILVYDDLQAMSRGAAELVASRARAAGDRFALALAGGSTPRPTYQLLAEPPLRDRIPWSKVHVFWGDERCVPADDERSNARMARRALLERVPLPAENIHPIPGERGAREAAERYRDLLDMFFGGAPPRFDMLLLGMGADGHTASLFPHSPALAVDEPVVAVEELHEGTTRVTLSARTINRSAVVAFLVSGGDKAEAVKAVLEGPRDAERFPAQLVRPGRGELRFLLDRDAGSLLDVRGEGGAV